jgi:hypothetical protein
MVVIINDSGSVYDDTNKLSGGDYMNPETGDMLNAGDFHHHHTREYLQRCNITYSDESEKNRHLNLEDINP